MLFALFCFALPALAQDSIIVTATKGESASRDLPFFSEKIPGEEWERKGARVESALSGIPGLSFSAAGGPGQTRSVFLRGARAEDTLVLLYGIPLNDPLSPSRSFDFSQIPAGNIESIEILKGPQSVLYGSDAMGGVVQIFTRPEGPPRLKAEGGSYGTYRGRASYLGFHGGYERVEGFSAADEAQGNTEKDSHRSWNIGGVKDITLGERANLRLRALYQDAKTDTDRSGGAGGDSTGTFARNSQLLFRAEALKVSGGGYEWTTAGSLRTSDRDDNTVSPAFYRARIWKAETGLRRRFGKHLPAAGAEYQVEAGRSSEIEGRRSFRNAGLYLQDHFVSGRWQAMAGARLDFHSEHPKAATFRAGLGYWLVPETLKGKASLGSGFKAPSLYQTYSAYGTPNLNPSRVVGGDLGLELTAGKWAGELAYYRNSYTDLIDFDAARSRFFNVGKARTSGFEFALSRWLGFFELKASLTTIRAVDRRSGQKLLRRPELSCAFEAAFRKGDFVGAAVRVRYVGEREDLHPSLFTRQPMPGFYTAGIDFFHRLSADWKLTARAENIFNRHYQEISGFGTPGRSGYLGLEAEL